MRQEVFLVGPVPMEDEKPLFIVGSSGDRGHFSAEGASVAEALAELRAQVDLEGASCSPLLSEWAASFGMRPGPLSEEAASGAMALALGLEYELSGKPRDVTGVLLELAELSADYLRARPWERFAASAPLLLELEGALRRKVWARVSEESVSLFFSEEGAARLDRAYQTDDVALLRDTEMISVFFDDDEPAFLAEAMEAFSGVRAAPTLVRTGDGETRLPSVAEVAALVAALDAITAAVGDDPHPGECFAVKASATLRLKAPAPAPAPAPVDPFAGVDRNDPCPCGSGRKFKKCHLGAASPLASKAAAAAAVSPWHQVDGQLVRRMRGAADALVGPGWREVAAGTLFGPRQVHEALLIPYVAFEHRFPGGTLAERFLASGAQLSSEERAWIAANQRAWVALCEVLEVEKGRGARVVDLRSGRHFFLSDVGLAQSVHRRLSVLARLVEVDGEMLAVGSHPQPLQPEDADAVVEQLVSEEPLSLPVAVRAWDDQVSKVALRAASPMTLSNTDGEPLLFVEERFRFPPSRREEVLAGLGRMEGSEPPHEEEGSLLVAFSRPGNRLHPTWSSTQIASARVEKKGLVLTTNSAARADDFQRRLLSQLPWLERKERKETKPPEGKGGRALAFDVQGMAVGPGGTALAARELSLAFLESPLPELDGRTPRSVVATDEGRAKVHRLLRRMECDEARSAPRMDGFVSATELRALLGLDERGAVDPLHALRAAIGFGRKASDTLVDFAQEAIAVLAPRSDRERQRLLQLAVGMWNSVVLKEDVEQVPKELLRDAREAVAFVRKSIGLQAETLLALQARKKAVFGPDRRLFANVQFSDGYLSVMAFVPEPWATRLRASGLRLPGQVG